MANEIIRSVRNETQLPIKLGVGNVTLPVGKTVDLFKLVSDDILLLLQGQLSGLENRKSITVLKRELKDTLTLANDRQARKDITDLSIVNHDNHDLMVSNKIDIDSHTALLTSIQTEVSIIVDQVSDLDTSKSLRQNLIPTADLTPSIQADANTQTASYVQPDVQSIADLTNDLKDKVNIATTLINELKAKVNNLFKKH